MRIGPFEITWRKPKRPWAGAIDLDRTGAFAVPDFEPWWLAVHQTINEAEAETVTASRMVAVTGDANRCIAAIGAGEGCDLVRQKLIDKRNIALKEVGGNAKGNQSAQGL